MPPGNEDRKEIYKRARLATGLNKRQWARLFSLGELKGAAEVTKKERGTGELGSRGVNMPEALAAGLLEYLHREGKDVGRIEFDQNGNILAVPNRNG